jgi:hypothetical protein
MDTIEGMRRKWLRCLKIFSSDIHITGNKDEPRSFFQGQGVPNLEFCVHSIVKELQNTLHYRPRKFISRAKQRRKNYNQDMGADTPEKKGAEHLTLEYVFWEYRAWNCLR